MGIGNVHIVQVAIECGLIGCAWMECDFDAASLSRRVVVDVEVGRLVEAMEERSWSRRIKVGMSVDVPRLRSDKEFESGSRTYTVASISSPGKGGMTVENSAGGCSFKSVNFQKTRIHSTTSMSRQAGERWQDNPLMQSISKLAWCCACESERLSKVGRVGCRRGW